MKINLDLRMARLPCGGRTYTTELSRGLLALGTDDQFEFYHNPWCEYQQGLVAQIREAYPERVSDGQIRFTDIEPACLTLKHHFAFGGKGKDADVSHYLHFDMPLSMKSQALVQTIHDLYPLCIPRYCGALKRSYFEMITRRSTRRARLVISVSQQTRQDLIKYLEVPEEKLVVIPHGYNEAFQRIKDESQLETVRQRHQLPERFVLYTGMHKPHKNLSRLFQAFARLKPAIREYFPLYLTGPETEDTAQLKALANELGIQETVHFLGLLPGEDLPALYNLASLYVLPSLYEGFGFGPLEAMACGTPVACSNSGALPEVVGPAGWLFDPYSVEAMSDRLHAALENDVGDPRVTSDCLRQARRFSWSKSAKMTHDVYRQASES